MRIITLPLLTLTTLPALAQDRWQVCLGLDSQPEQSVSYRLDQTYARFEQEARVAPSLQVGYRFLELAKSDLSLTAETQFKSRSDTRFLAAGDGPVQEVRGKSHQRYVARASSGPSTGSWTTASGCSTVSPGWRREP